jgi:hypothetical protein
MRRRARDRAVEKLIEFMADAAESSAVLVFGGFHRSAIEILDVRVFLSDHSPVISNLRKNTGRYRNLMAADYETRFVPLLFPPSRAQRYRGRGTFTVYKRRLRN